MAQVLAPVGGGSNNGEVITLADGGYMAVWTHLVTPILPIPGVTDDKGGFAILGRAFNADGTPRGAVFQVNQSLNNSGQGGADLALLTNGNVAVVWQHGPDIDDDFDVAARGRLFSADGTPLTDEFDLSSTTENDQQLPEVVATPGGGFMTSWSDGRFSNTDERWFAQAFDAAGNPVGPELFLIREVDATTEGQLIDLGNGSYHVSGDSSVTFDPSETYTSSSNLPIPTRLTFQSSSGQAANDIVGNGQGKIVEAGNRGEYAALTVTLLEAVEAFNASGDPDRPEFATSITNSPSTVSSTGNFVYLPIFDPGWMDGNRSINPADYTATAATFLPNGNIALVWAGPSGGTLTEPVVSVFAQILSPQLVPISDRIEIETDVQGGAIYPPFVSAGDDGKLFIGWTGTTDRVVAGMNEVFGGVFDIPTYAPGSTSADGSYIGSDGADTVTGIAADTYLFAGDDLWIQGPIHDNFDVAAYGMEGDDRFVVTEDPGNWVGTLVPGLGYDTLDLSMVSQPIGQFDLILRTLAGRHDNSDTSFEAVIGTLGGDYLRAPQGSSFDDRGLSALLHTEAGDDTIEASGTHISGTVDGGAGFDVMVTGFDRADFELTLMGDHYTLAYLHEDFATGTRAVDPNLVLTLRSIEEIRFGDQVVTLQATASQESGGASSGSLLPNEVPGTPGPDDLPGTAGADRITGLAGNDTLAGFAGNDTLEAGPGNDLAYAGAGNDVISGGDGLDSLYGADGADTIRGGDGADLLGGGTGNDSLSGEGGNDTAYGAAGDDTLSGGDGADLLGGGAGNDNLSGGAGDDALWTTQGDDTASGGAGNDTLGGFTGNDSLSGDAGDDELWGAAGNDTLDGGLGADRLGGGIGDDALTGGDGNDSLYGGLGADTVSGGFGDDLIYGAAGNDLLSGGAGDDTLFAGPGNDTVRYGDGDGADELQFFSVVDDVLELDDALWTGTLTAAEVVTQFGGDVGADYVLDFGNGDTITLAGAAGIAGLEAAIDIV